MKKIGIVAFLAACCFAAFAFVWWIFQLLWNAIAADVFGAPELTYWQAAGVMILLGMITSGFRSSRK